MGSDKQECNCDQALSLKAENEELRKRLAEAIKDGERWSTRLKMVERRLDRMVAIAYGANDERN